MPPESKSEAVVGSALLFFSHLERSRFMIFDTRFLGGGMLSEWDLSLPMTEYLKLGGLLVLVVRPFYLFGSLGSVVSQ